MSAKGKTRALPISSFGLVGMERHQISLSWACMLVVHTRNVEKECFILVWKFRKRLEWEWECVGFYLSQQKSKGKRQSCSHQKLYFSFFFFFFFPLVHSHLLHYQMLKSDPGPLTLHTLRAFPLQDCFGHRAQNLVCLYLGWSISVRTKCHVSVDQMS